MLRDKNLIPLSRQHQHALALCVRIDRAQPVAASDLEAWQAEIKQEFEQEIGIHFAAEENFIFPVASNFSDLVSLVCELSTEHDWLRREFSRAEQGSMSTNDLPHFARKLALHIRKEERVLFERLQSLLKPEEMATLGVSLNQALREASQACVLPRQATRIQAAKDRSET